MFNSLTDKISGIFSNITKRSTLKESDLIKVIDDLGNSLLEADVALSVVKELQQRVKNKALSRKVLHNITPGQAIIKVVHSELKAILEGRESDEQDIVKTRYDHSSSSSKSEQRKALINFAVQPPAVIMMVGLQGAGKTTTTGKLAHFIKSNNNKKILLASIDIQRAAAQKQLEVLAKQSGVHFLIQNPGECSVDIAKRALNEAQIGGYDILIIDTAGCLESDANAFDQLQIVKRELKPIETFLVVDSLMGQRAAYVSKSFHEAIGVTGIILTRLDADSNGGAALSMRMLSGCDIRFVGVGENLSQLDPFQSEVIVSSILGSGGLMSLLEEANQKLNAEQKESVAKNIKQLEQGKFNFNILLDQIRAAKKLNNMNDLFSKLASKIKIPGVNNVIKSDNAYNMLTKNEAIICSMTPKERCNPEKITKNRKIVIAKGAGVTPADVSDLLNKYKQLCTMVKSIGGRSGAFGRMSDIFKSV